MSVFFLDESLYFPPAHLANEEGIVAVGGDLSVDRILEAYRNGIFPWFSEETPILWWSPDPRMILLPHRLKISKSMKQVLRKNTFRISFDQDFQEVIYQCKIQPRKGQDGTWITNDMAQAYIQLHKKGFAHSVEVWKDNQMVGGLYGISLGKIFFGESMFSKVSNASKAGFITLIKELEKRDFKMIDCQVYTQHLESLGAEEIPRKLFLTILHDGLAHPTLKGNWQELFL